MVVSGGAWTVAELATLKTCDTSQPWPQLLALFPGRTQSGIRKKLKKLKLRRLRTTNNEFSGLAGRMRETLYNRRAALGISGRGLSKTLGYNESAVKDWESGAGTPALRSLIDWADGLGMEVVVMRRMG